MGNLGRADKGKKGYRESRTKAGRRQDDAALLFVTIYGGFVIPRVCKTWETQGS